MFARQFFEMTAVLKQPIPVLAEWMADSAALQEKHELLPGIWDKNMPGPSDFRQHSTALVQGMAAAKNRDRALMLQLFQDHEAAKLSINMNANYIAMRSIRDNDERIRHNAGYPLKEQMKKFTLPTSVRSTPMVIKVKKGPDPRSVAVIFERDPAAGLYHLQMSLAKPQGEDSWFDKGFFKGCRVIISDLEPASWPYFRGCSVGHNQSSPWSEPVGIIVT